MPLSTEQKVDLLYKKLFDRPVSDIDRQYYEEDGAGAKIILPSQVWEQPPDTSDPTTPGNQVALVSAQSFTWIPGTEAGFQLIGITNIVPFNYGTGTGLEVAPTGYNYALTTNAGDPIPFGVNDWHLDPASGVLIFFNGLPTGVSTSVPPKITCYRYTGGSGVSGIPSQITFTSASLSSGVLTWNHNLGYLGLMPSITDDSGERVEPTNIQDSDSNTMLIDLNGYTVSGTWRASISV